MSVLLQAKYDPPIGQIIDLSDEVKSIVAPNASYMTFKGTQTYIIGKGDSVALIDPWPIIESHLQALEFALEKKKLVGLFITHSHTDHSPLGKIISKKYNVPIFGFGDSESGRSAIMQKLSKSDNFGGGEGVDKGFEPDISLSSNDFVSSTDWVLEAIHTPGHMSNHLCFSLNNGEVLFTGDLIMGWSTTLISPPDGDVGQYKDSLALLLNRKDQLYYPGHGAPILEGKTLVKEHLIHRIQREKEILLAICKQGSNILEIVEKVYPDLTELLKPAASRNVFAHLINFFENGLITIDTNNPSTKSKYFLK